MEKHAKSFIRFAKKDDNGKMKFLNVYLDTEHEKVLEQLQPKNSKDPYLRVHLAAMPGDGLIKMKFKKSEIKLHGKVDHEKKSK